MRYFLRLGFVLLFVFWGFDGVGQDFKCGTPSPTPKEYEEMRIYHQEFDKQKARNVKQGRVQATQLIVKVKIHIVRKTNGSGGVSISELNDIFVTLRSKLNVYPLNVRLEYLPTIDYIDDNYYYYYGNIDSIKEGEMCNLRDATNAVNLYFVGTLDGAGGYAYTPNYEKRYNRIVIPSIDSNGTSTFLYNSKAAIPHEFGHYFGLLHTFDNPAGSNILTLERVNGSNCGTTGDQVCDTNADPFVSSIGGCKRYNYLTGNCFWGGSLYNCNYIDTNRDLYNPPINNQMSYWTINEQCWDDFYFTSGQYNRMEGGRYLRENYAYTSDLSQRYYLDGLRRILISPTTSNRLFCGGNTISFDFGIYGEPSFVNATSTARLVNSNGGYYDVGSISGSQNFKTITIPSNVATGYYELKIYNSYAFADVQSSITVYINGTTNGISTGSPIASQYALATTTLYNATSTCAGNSIALYGSLSGYDSYWWTKNGQNYTASSTNSYLNASSTGNYTLNMMKCGNVYRSSNSIYLTFYNSITPSIVASSNGLLTNSKLITCEGSPVRLSTGCQSGMNPLWSDGFTSSIRYFTATSTKDFAVNCSNYFCNTGYSAPVRIVSLNSNTQSTKNGNWEDITLWTSNITPLNCQTVTIQAGHTVNVPINDAKAKNIIIRGNLNFQNVSPTVKGKVGLGI